jgi:hypothetical protein
MDEICVNIIILPMLRYFQLLYDYFSLISIISPYIIYVYLWLFSKKIVIFGYFWLFHLTLFLVILSFFGYFSLFHLKLF